jgi:hypothetical protein
MAEGLDPLIERLKRQGAPRGALVLLNHLRREGGPLPASEARAFLQLGERHFVRIENLLLDEGVLLIYVERVAGKRRRMYALREWLPVLDAAS